LVNLISGGQKSLCIISGDKIYLDDFLPLELEEARSGIGESEVGGADPRALLRLEEVVLLEVVLLGAGLLDAAVEAGFARASAALK
jgi:hypothetical protein